MYLAWSWPGLGTGQPQLVVWSCYCVVFILYAISILWYCGIFIIQLYANYFPFILWDFKESFLSCVVHITFIVFAREEYTTTSLQDSMQLRLAQRHHIKQLNNWLRTYMDWILCWPWILMCVSGGKIHGNYRVTHQKYKSL